MADDIPTDKVIDARGLRFRGAEAVLTPAELAELSDGGLEDGLARAALSVARPAERVLILGGGSGLVPAVLAGRLGVRHLTVVEPDPTRRRYLERVVTDNGLVRTRLASVVPSDAAPSLVICDLSQAAAPPLPQLGAGDGLRGAVLRLPDTCAEIAGIFTQMITGGLIYFPRQSSGNVVTFLAKWH